VEVVTEPGRISENILMLDVIGWKFPKTTSTFVLIGKDVAIIEPGHRSCAANIIEGLRSFKIDFNAVKYILVSHRHSDHAGGGPPLLAHMPNSVLVGHKYTIETYKDPSRINVATRELFGEFGEPIDKVEDETRLMVVKGSEVIDIGKGVEIEVVHTPGHTSDHLMFYEKGSKMIFCGDGAGIFGARSRTPIPTSFPPSFKYEEYKRSLEKILSFDLKIVAFAHFGAVIGPDASNVIHTALEVLEDWKSIALNAYEKSKDIAGVASSLKQKYYERLEVFPPKFREVVFEPMAYGLLRGLGILR